jgi:cation diffusion facilitator CzcD-associated flavoprotein CzcO
VDAQLNLSSDIRFNSTVVSATFNEKRNNWFVTCDDGKKFIANHVVAGVGFAAKRYIPDWKDMDTCMARIVHTSFWTDDIDVKGKKVVVVGSGSSGVQVAQECAKDVAEMTVFIRTPNTCMPMQQASLSIDEQEKEKETYPDVYKHRLTTYGGLMYSPQEFPHTAHSPEEREAFFNKLWEMVSLLPFPL